MALRPRPVLLTRPQPQLARSAQRLQQAGHQVISLPLLRIAAPSHPPRASDLHWAANAQWMVFTSQHAVEAAFRLWQRPPGPRIAAVGQATAAALQSADWPVHWVPPHSDSESLVNAANAPDWQGDIALMSGRGGRRSIKQQLQIRGCRVRKILLYQRQAQHWPESDLRQAVAASPIAVFTSGFGLRHWQELMNQHALQSGLRLDALVASPRLCKLASQLGFAGRIQALHGISDAAILTALNEWNHD